jgi:hypothetical protein
MKRLQWTGWLLAALLAGFVLAQVVSSVPHAATPSAVPYEAPSVSLSAGSSGAPEAPLRSTAADSVQPTLAKQQQQIDALRRDQWLRDHPGALVAPSDP